MDLNEKEKQKLNVVIKVINGEITKKDAILILDISRKQLNRLIVKYETEGEKGFIHKNRGKTNNNQLNEELKQEIIQLYLNEYYDYNFTHFYEEIREKINVSYISVCRVLKEADILSPEAQHKTIRLYNSAMKKAIETNEITEEQLKLYEQRQEEEIRKHMRLSTLHYKFGQEVQMDATFAIWFGEDELALHLAVDKATKKVLYGLFYEQETTYAYFILLKNILQKWGIPKEIKTDKRGSFSVNYKNLKLNSTRFGKACRELGISLRSSSVPTFKGNVERANKTFKGRLISELRHQNITTIEEANTYLNDVFIPKLNNNFSYEIKKDKNDMRENTFTEEELNIILSERHKRKIDNACCVKYINDYYIPGNILTGEVMYYSRNTECEIIIAFDKSLWCFVNEELHLLIPISKEPIKRVKTTKTIEEINRSKAHTPASNHPWRRYKKN